jgi:hypothetical protein
MKLSANREASSCPATQELPSILWYPNVHYRIYKNPPLILSWARPIQSTPPYPICPRSILILSTHLCLGLPSGPLDSRFPINNPYAFLFSSFVLHAPPMASFSTKLKRNYVWWYANKRVWMPMSQKIPLWGSEALQSGTSVTASAGVRTRHPKLHYLVTQHVTIVFCSLAADIRVTQHAHPGEPWVPDQMVLQVLPRQTWVPRCFEPVAPWLMRKSSLSRPQEESFLWTEVLQQSLVLSGNDEPESALACSQSSSLVAASLPAITGRAVAQAVSLRPGFVPRSGHMGFVVNEAALG